MKYRRLQSDELRELSDQFIGFLAANTVTAPEWEQLKKNEPDKAEGLIEIFSDTVFQQTLERVEYLELKTPQDIKIFHCLDEEIRLMGLTIEGESDLDFTANATPEAMIRQINQSDAQLKLYRARKKYTKERELELFDMMEKGCRISKGELYRTLKGMVDESDEG